MDPTLGHQEDTPPFNQQEVHNKKNAAGILAIVLFCLGFGWVGVHKFMLGMNKPALISLLVSILTCGVGAVVFNIISLIEGIIYILKSDEEFYELYIVQKKEWF